MKQLYFFKIITFLIGSITILANSFDVIYAYFYNKPTFVHFYPIKKRVSKQQKQFLKENIKFYKELDEKHKDYFEHRLAVFIRNYHFVGKENFEITPEIMVLIASSYIKLTFGMRRYITTMFEKIIVFPSAFYSAITKQYHKGEYNPAFKMVLFSWEDFLLGDMITYDNLNLGIHEFVHVLTFHGKKSKDVSASIFYRGYKDLITYVKKENRLREIEESNYFRTYAFTNKVEFVAVITEHFFESPQELQQQFPELYLKLEMMLNYKSILN